MTRSAPSSSGRYEHRRGEGVVHDQQAIVLVGQLRQPLDIDQPQERIGHRLDEQHAGRLFQGFAHRIEIAGIDKGRLDAVADQFLSEQLRGSAIEAVAGHDAVALLRQGQQGRADGGHAGTAHDRPLPPSSSASWSARSWALGWASRA